LKLRFLLLAALFILSLLTTPHLSRAETLALRESPRRLTFNADSLDVDGETIVAEGNVTIAWDGKVLTADHARYERVGGNVVAKGDVVLIDTDGNRVECESVSLNMETLEGEITEGNLYLSDSGYRISAKSLRRTGELTYEATDASFTACDGSSPSWRFDADWLKVRIEEFLTGGNAVFRIEEVPVLYTPWLIYPAKTQRTSGFLPPKAGWTTRGGTELKIPFYWAFADNADITMTTDYKSRLGLGETFDLRYILAEGHEGNFKVKVLHDKEEDDNEAEVKGEHLSRFGRDDLLDLKVDYVSDASDYREDSETLELRGIVRKESRVYGAHTMEPGTLFLLGRWTQALLEPQGDTLQQLPRLGFYGVETPVVYGVNSFTEVEATRFKRDEGVDGDRFRVNQGLTKGFGDNSGGVRLGAGYRYNYYDLNSETSEKSGPWLEADGRVALGREWGEALHIVEPNINWRWEEQNRDDEVEYFDEEDIFKDSSTIFLGLTNRILNTENLRELFLLEFGREVGVRHLTRQGFASVDWENYRAVMEISPFADVKLRLDGEYADDDGGRFNRWTGLLTAKDRRGDELRFERNYIRGEADYLDGGLIIPFNESVSASYRNRFSLKDDIRLEDEAGLKFSHPCWEVTLTYSRVYMADEDRIDYRYYATVTLAGLNRLGKFRW